MGYDNTDTGIIYSNTDKNAPGGNPAWPDIKGFVNVGGVEYWVSGWRKIGKEGSKMAGKAFYSLTLKEKDAPSNARRPSPTNANQGNQGNPFFDDDIGF